MEHDERQCNEALTPQEKHVSALLDEALFVHAPENLANRLFSASCTDLRDAVQTAFEFQLDEACSITAPKGLEERVYTASVNNLGHSNPVIARITPSVMWRQVALAACVLFAVLVAVQFGSQTSDSTLPNLQVATNVLTIEDEELLFEDLNLTEYSYLVNTRELAFADVAIELNNLREEIELWQYGLLSE